MWISIKKVVVTTNKLTFYKPNTRWKGINEDLSKYNI